MLTNLARSLTQERREQVEKLLPRVRETIAAMRSHSTVSGLHGISEIVFYSCVQSNQSMHKLYGYTWCFVAEGFSRDHQVAAIYVYADSYTGKLQVKPYCPRCIAWNGANRCEHSDAVVNTMAVLADSGQPAEFTGAFHNDGWGRNDPDIQEVDWTPEPDLLARISTRKFLRIPELLGKLAAWPEGHQVVIRLDDRSVQLEDGTKRGVIERLYRTAEGKLVTSDPDKFDLPDEEREWLDRVLKMGKCREERMSYVFSKHDESALAMFANAGRAYTGDTQVAYAGGVEAMLAWEPADLEHQRLVVKLEQPWVWMGGEAGPVLNATKTRLAAPRLSKQMVEALLALPPLSDERAKEVREAWAHHPLLGRTILPLPPVERRIEDKTLTWVGYVFERPVATASDDDGEGARRAKEIVLRIELREGDTPVDIDLKNGQLKHIADDLWHRYAISGSHPGSTIESLSKMGFAYAKQEVAYEIVAPAGTSLALVDLALSLFKDQKWLQRPAGVKAQIVGNKEGEHIHLVAAVKRASKTAPAPYELTMRATAGGTEVEIPLLLRSIEDWSPIRTALEDHLAPVDEDDFDDDGLSLVEIATGRFILSELDALNETVDAVSTLVDHAVARGDKRYLTEGALLRLATTSGLPIEAGDILDHAKGRVAELVKAQQPVGAREIAGIEGITFSPSQAAGVEWMLVLLKQGLGGILADKRGAGKTFQALGAIAESRKWRKQHKKGPAVVMMELKELDHWVANHIIKHCHGLRWEVFHNRKPDQQALEAADVVITTYGVFQRHVERFRDLNPTYVFADEAKRLKNRASKTWKAINSFEGPSIISINGTPLTRNMRDVWSGFELAAPGFLGSVDRFAKSYRENGDDPAYRARLTEAMKPLFIRRDIDNGRGMPAKTRLRQLVTMTPEQSNTYINARGRVIEQIKELEGTLSAGQLRFRTRQMLDRLRGITASPGRPGHLTSKGEVILEMVSEFVDDDHQVLVFSHNNSYVDAIAEILRGRKGRGIPTSVFRGSDAKERNREKRLFQDGHSRVLVLSDLGARGLDLPQASRVIITDPWIDADEDDQMADRARRFTSVKDLEVFHLICAGTLEEGAMEVLERNREHEQALLEDAPTPAPGLSQRTSIQDYEHLLRFAPSGDGDGGSSDDDDGED